jgi:hypothetical protein
MFDKILFFFIDDHPVMGAFLIVVLIGCLVCVPAYLANYATCSAKAEVMGTDYKFGFYEGCFIKEDGKWVDYDRYRIINQE